MKRISPVLIWEAFDHLEIAFHSLQSMHTLLPAEELYGKEYREALDNLATGLRDRFSAGDDGVLADVEAALGGDLDKARRAGRFYGFDTDRLELHLRMMWDMGHRPKTMTQAAEVMSTLIVQPGRHAV